jgi:Uri superfamily endonuclease
MTKGIYVLIISISENIHVNIGALGKILFGKGLYAYVGSAQNNLEKRIERHLRKNKQLFWHIDYLLDDCKAKIRAVFYKNAEKPEECRIATQLGKAGISIKRFGSSDCSCESHLFRLQNYEFLRETMHELPLKSGKRRS